MLFVVHDPDAVRKVVCDDGATPIRSFLMTAPSADQVVFDDGARAPIRSFVILI